MMRPESLGTVYTHNTLLNGVIVFCAQNKRINQDRWKIYLGFLCVFRKGERGYMKTKKTKEAVSLIVLVLTIVIMIILAGVIVISLNNSGIIDRAKNAVSETNLKNMQELANVAWGEAYLAIKGEKTAETLKETMMLKLKGKV